MAYRWVLSPLVEVIPVDPETGERGKPYYAPRVATLKEPKRAKGYQHTSVISAGGWCLSLVLADDFSVIEDDTLCLDLFVKSLDTPFDDSTTLTDLGLKPLQITRLLDKLAERGVDVTDIARDTAASALLRRVITAFDLDARLEHLLLFRS